MTQTFLEFLTARNVDSEAIQQAARFYLAERTNSLTKRKMRQQLDQALGDPEAVNTVLKRLEQDSLAAENAALALLSWAWEEPGERERVIRSIEQSKVQLPIIEVTLIAIVAMYGMYLIATEGGKKKELRRTKRREDGTLEEEETTTEWGSFAEVLSEIIKLPKPPFKS